MKKTIAAMLLIAVLALSAEPGLSSSTANVTLTVLCFNTSINLSTDKQTYQYTETADMTVLLNNSLSIEDLNQMLLIDMYDNVTGALAARIAADNATAPAGGTNTTVYQRNFSDMSAGNYTLRARLVLASSYPQENVTGRDCSLNGLPIESNANITITSQAPNAPLNLVAILNKTAGENYEDVTLNWSLSNSTNIHNYIIYKTDSWSTGFNYSEPYATVSNTSYNWTDTNASGVNERYYVVRANNTLNLTDYGTYSVGKYNIGLYTGWNLISLPLLIWNSSMNDVFYTAEESDFCERWTGSGQSYQRADYSVDFGWYNQFTISQVDRGYWYYSRKAGYGSSPFNNSVVGAVPTANRSETIYSQKWSLLGWTSVNSKTLNSLFTNATDADLMEYYNAQTDVFRRADYSIDFGWYNQFSTLDPPRGYWYYSTNTTETQYTWGYQP